MRHNTREKLQMFVGKKKTLHPAHSISDAAPHINVRSPYQFSLLYTTQSSFLQLQLLKLQLQSPVSSCGKLLSVLHSSSSGVVVFCIRWQRVNSISLTFQDSPSISSSAGTSNHCRQLPKPGWYTWAAGNTGGESTGFGWEKERQTGLQGSWYSF